MVWVAPNSRAKRQRCSCTSTAMIGSQPAILAAISAGQTDSADPEHDKTIARRGLHHVEDRAGAGLAAAGQCRRMFERCVVTHFHGEALVGDGEGAERGLLEKGAIDRLAVDANAGSSRRRACRYALRSLACDAIASAGACGSSGIRRTRIRHHHVVARLEIVDRATDRAHDAGALMPEHCWVIGHGIVSRHGRAGRSRTCREATTSTSNSSARGSQRSSARWRTDRSSRTPPRR